MSRREAASAGRRYRTPQPERPATLRKRDYERRGRTEWDPGRLPCICDGCGVVLGLVEEGGALFCVECGQWSEPTVQYD